MTNQPPKPCDQCLHRKVRCDKVHPHCIRCVNANLLCTWDVSRRAPGRKKGSGTVLARLRGTETREQAKTSGSERYRRTQRARQSCQPLAASPGSVQRDGDSQEGPDNALALSASLQGEQRIRSRSGSSDIAVGILSTVHNLSRYVDLFFARLFPIWPIVPELSFRESLKHPEQLDQSQICLILSMCALTALHIEGSTDPIPEPRRMVAQGFIDQCRQIRSTFDYIGSGSTITVQTSLFMSCAEVEFQRTRSSWFLLRESVMLAQELGLYTLDLPSSTANQDEILSIRRTLYLISLVERGLTVLRSKPFSFITFDPPRERFGNEDPKVLYGLQCLSRLFNFLDKNFLDAWVSYSTKSATEILPKDAAIAQGTLDILTTQEKLAKMTFNTDKLIDVQMTDILVTQQWLRLVFWQFAMRKGVLSSMEETPEVLRYDFPCRIAESLCGALNNIQTEAISTHGVAIVSTLELIESCQITDTATNGGKVRAYI